MINKKKLEKYLLEYEIKYNFPDGYHLLYCPWKILGKVDVAFISLNPGATNNPAGLRIVSDERGNSYEVERYTTKSPLTAQFLELCNFIKRKPNTILTGSACPFRGNRWSDFSLEQKKIGFDKGKSFWSKALDSKVKLIITIGSETTELITNLKNAKLELELNSGWGNYNIRRFNNNEGVEVIQLLHLSTFKLFSRPECRGPLEKIFENFINKF